MPPDLTYIFLNDNFHRIASQPDRCKPSNTVKCRKFINAFGAEIETTTDSLWEDMLFSATLD